MLKLKLQYLGHLMQTDNSLEKSQMLGKIEGRKKRGCQRMRCLDSITDAMNMNLANLWDMLRDREAWYAVVHGVSESDMTGQLNSNNSQKKFVEASDIVFLILNNIGNSSRRITALMFFPLC